MNKKVVDILSHWGKASLLHAGTPPPLVRKAVVEKMRGDLEEDSHMLLVGMQITVATIELEDSSVGTVPASNASHINQSR